MSPAALALVLAVAFMGLAIVLNHCHARLALLELTLNEGLPPGYQRVTESSAPTQPIVEPAELSQLVGTGIHIFLSRNCHACQRLVDELDQTSFQTTSSLHLRYVDRPRPIATSAAERAGAELHEQQAELATQVGADPLPFTVAIGDHGLVARAVTPTVAQVAVTTRDAGMTMDTVVNP